MCNNAKGSSRRRIARRKGYGSPPLPMTPAEASKIGRKKIAANINEVVAKRKLTQGY